MEGSATSDTSRSAFCPEMPAISSRLYFVTRVPESHADTSFLMRVSGMSCIAPRIFSASALVFSEPIASQPHESRIRSQRVIDQLPVQKAVHALAACLWKERARMARCPGKAGHSFNLLHGAQRVTGARVDWRMASSRTFQTMPPLFPPSSTSPPARRRCWASTYRSVLLPCLRRSRFSP